MTLRIRILAIDCESAAIWLESEHRYCERNETMGFMRKSAILLSGGTARAVINPNSKKARSAKANEKMLKLQRAEAKRARKGK